MYIKKIAANINEVLDIKPFHSNSISSIEQQEKYRRLLRFVIVSATTCALFIEPTLASAAPTGTAGTAGTSNLEAAANRLLTALTTGLGRTLAALGVVTLGIMAMFGKLAWDTAIKVIIGIALVFGAASVVSWIAGS